MENVCLNSELSQNEAGLNCQTEKLNTVKVAENSFGVHCDLENSRSLSKCNLSDEVRHFVKEIEASIDNQQTISSSVTLNETKNDVKGRLTSPDSNNDVLYSCWACYKNFKTSSNLDLHLRSTRHSAHEPICSCCGKHFRHLESLREHLLGNKGSRVAKKTCMEEFNSRGCLLCLQFMKDEESRNIHFKVCNSYARNVQDENGSSLNSKDAPRVDKVWPLEQLNAHIKVCSNNQPVFALDCEMVGGGLDGKIDVCARVCMVDQNENVIFDDYVSPTLHVTDYRTDITGMTEEILKKGISLKTVRRKVHNILFCKKYELSCSKMSSLLVGHDLRHDLSCLFLDYDPDLIRDTAFYPPLLRTNGMSHSLKHLVKTFLGYDIQGHGYHDPKEDAIAALRLYKKLKCISHPPWIHHHLTPNNGDEDGKVLYSIENNKPWLVRFPPPRDYSKSTHPYYTCWCLDK